MKSKRRSGGHPNGQNRKDPARREITNERVSSTVIYGVIPVLELLRSGRRGIDKLVIAENLQPSKIREVIEKAKERKIKIDRVSKNEFPKYFKDDTNHQGIIAFATAANYYNSEQLLSEVIEKEASLSLILDGVEDPMNLGAILRTAEGANIDGVFMPERRAVGLTETVSKASAGAAEYVKVAKVKSVNNLIDEMKANNIWVVGTSGDAQMDYMDWDWRQSTALVLGSEGKGLHRLTAEKCDVLVKIPMYGKIESLNVSVAGGVVLFEAMRQRIKV